MVHEGFRSLATERTHNHDKLSEKIRGQLYDVDRPTAEDYANALDQVVPLRQAFDALMDTYDALLVPSAIGEAPPTLDSTGNALFNRPWTTLGVPCVTLPGYVGPTNLPVGVQLVGRYNRDDALLSVSAWASARIQ